MGGHDVLGVCTLVVCYVLTSMSPVCEGQELPRACDTTICQLPTCFCSGTRIPSRLDPANTPQMVLFTFDDAVKEQTYKPLMDLFGSDTERKNPNGCPIGMTLFVSHTFTNHCQVAEFYLGGHEIASHSITHKLPIIYWADAPEEEYDNEIHGQKKILSRLAGIDPDHIQGYRSPFLQPGGDTQFSVLRDRKFKYDSSLFVPSLLTEDPYWPYTLDYPYQLPCNINPCPKEAYPGLWELPIQPIPDHTGTPCTFLDRCMEAMTSEQIYGYLRDSFDRHYTRNRAPLILNIHAYWFNNNEIAFTAFDRFIKEIVAMDDVYVITSFQLVAWMRDPTTLDDVSNFQPWQCPERTVKTCSKTILRAGLDRTKKADFEAYKSQIYGLIRQGQKDGGRSLVQWTLFLFIIIFIYIHYKEAS